ncbi:MAG: hypothetical protein MTP17_00770 [Candidatus Midichloria sp.]|nr:MAG: hypothetical protein MTP17_00330 [Candidatus Midichloria sp.]WHQ46914.1 MAG: hypothetical protein MTP17_00770 [Candidatus Midichloria sp.]
MVIDNSVKEKAYTDGNEVTCWHYLILKGRHMKIINLLSCLIRYGDVSVPVGYKELFRKLVKQTIKNEINFAYILTDKLNKYLLNH